MVAPTATSAANNSAQLSKPGITLRLKIKQKILRWKALHPKSEKKEKLIAVGLAIPLGAFGVHRLYLGTADHVPFIYAITLGGGFYVLPVTDCILIIATKDLDKYKENPHFFMWTGSDEEE